MKADTRRKRALTHAAIVLIVPAAIVAGCSSTSSSASSKGAIGAACSGDTDCGTGMFCNLDDPGGQCLKKCAADADCGGGNICALDDGELKCYVACAKPTDCTRAGYGCVGRDGRDTTKTFCDTVATDAGEGEAGSSTDAATGG
jgi:hypothetical protein